MTTARGGQVMDDVTKTDKMLSRKDGRVGYVIFNNPERHNAHPDMGGTSRSSKTPG